MLDIVPIEKPEGVECIIGQGNFSIFTVVDLALALKTAVPGIEFGLAMNEAKPRLTRVEGTSESLRECAAGACCAIGAGHVFVIMMQKAFPINVLNTVKEYPTTCTVYAASENPLQVVVATTDLGRAVVGVVDGTPVECVENEPQREERKALLKEIGYT
ncbi:MAG: adenosine monophosphate-protein transferase [Theionarchaea archaeon]|nr:adenosine monophosphate-protein transferase [Theionarchaea archaeon]MBU7039091.1 adenosine monophosphate-protein transferase [Theionarchaea archaeon]